MTSAGTFRPSQDEIPPHVEWLWRVAKAIDADAAWIRWSSGSPVATIELCPSPDGEVDYGIITRVPAPPEAYDVLHQELLRRVGARIEGLLLHVGRATGHGFEVVEVWESKEQFDTFNDTVVRALMTELTDPETPPPPPQIEEFDVRGLVIPRGDVLV